MALNPDRYFPFDGYRPKQQAVLNRAAKALFEEKYDVVVIDGPTGIGKSGINVALARMAESAFYVTPQKKLRQQLQRDADLNSFYKSLKAREDYRCDVSGTDCKKCQINRSTESKCRDFAGCTYWNAKTEAMQAAIAVLTFAFLIKDYEVPTHTADGDSLSFRDRDVLIVDEAHNLESQSSSLFAGVTVNPYELPNSVYDGLVDHLDVDNTTRHEDVYAEMVELQDRCKEFISEYGEDDSLATEVDECKDMRSKLRWFFDEVDSRSRTWTVNMSTTLFNNKERNVVALQPVYVDSFLRKHVWSRANQIVLSSATIPYRGDVGKWLKRIGIPSSAKTLTIPVNMPFPAANRPIHTDTMIAKFSKGGDKDNWDAIMASLNDLAGKHEGQKGLVHTVSYDRAQRVYGDAGKYPNLKGNVKFHQGKKDTEQFLNEWYNSDKNIVVSPSMTEGVDLYDDRCRWQVLLKVPYPNMGDERVKYLTLEANQWQWYREQAAISIVQSAGRAVRSERDYADYYVLDECFEDIRSAVDLPEWFEEAIDADTSDRVEASGPSRDSKPSGILDW